VRDSKGDSRRTISTYLQDLRLQKYQKQVTKVAMAAEMMQKTPVEMETATPTTARVNNFS
jgi:hypothetical protein